MISEEVLYKTVAELGAMIRAKRISPVELAEGYLARLEKYGAKLGAVATLTRERAMAEARAAEKEIAAGKYRGALHGIPYGVKDLLAAKGYPTTWGAPPFKDQVFDYDATVVRKLGEAGAVLVAKLSMIELAGGGGYNSASASLQGPSRCPYNTDYWAGGSSSGPGAAVPSALVGFAIGSETVGSIITPAAFSGVSGLRPTYGRVSRYGAMALSWTMDKLGPMCRSAEDCGLVLAAISGRDPMDESSVDAPAFRMPGAKRAGLEPGAAKASTRAGTKPLAGKKLGVIRPDFESRAFGSDPEVGKLYAAALDVLKSLGAELADTSLPDYPYGALATTLYQAEAASIFRPLIESEKLQELVDETQKIGLVAALSLPARDYLDAFRVRVEVQRELGRLFEKFDAIVAPSRNGPANRVDTPFDAPPPRPAGETPPAKRPAAPPAGAGNATNVIGASNVAGLPALSVPCGFTAEKNLPAGIQFVADALREDICLELGAAYQKATEWHRKRPSL
jgi:aspartyl-tRNA(Asn)/glutamyl-tRNA(Gln) amidotransferase subunit A